MMSVGSAVYCGVLEWLIHEAELLDRQQFEEWLSLLAPDLAYVMPVRQSVYQGEDNGISERYAHFEETYGSMEVRVKRALLPSAWAEDPPSRTRRFVSNLRVRELGADLVAAESYLMLVRSRGDSPSVETISCERRDILRSVSPGSFVLVSRTIISDQTTLGVMNLSVFL